MKGTDQSSKAGRLQHLAAVAFALSACMGNAHRARAFSTLPPGGCAAFGASYPIHHRGGGRRSPRIIPAPSSNSRLHATEEEEEETTSSSTQQQQPSPPSCGVGVAPTTPPRPADMRLRDIQAELKGRSVSYADCFDRDSLERRLAEARDDSVVVVAATTSSSSGAAAPPVSGPASSPRGAETEGWEGGGEGSSSTTPLEETAPAAATETSSSVWTSTATAAEFDRTSTLAELRNLRVRELKEKLSEMKVRWGTMIEKEEMVKALCSAMEERFVRGLNFSRTGMLIPGAVADVDEDALIGELGWSISDVNRGVASPVVMDVDSSASSPAIRRPPLLLDVYATWCGPCQFMAPLLAKAAEELGSDVRVVKLDSDKYPRISSVLKGKSFFIFFSSSIFFRGYRSVFA